MSPYWLLQTTGALFKSSASLQRGKRLKCTLSSNPTVKKFCGNFLCDDVAFLRLYLSMVNYKKQTKHDEVSFLNINFTIQKISPLKWGKKSSHNCFFMQSVIIIPYRVAAKSIQQGLPKQDQKLKDLIQGPQWKVVSFFSVPFLSYISFILPCRH